jgi:uncharacterized protein (TIGR03089 family)
LRFELLGPLTAGDQHRPRLVVHTDVGRTELSGASLTNWTAKVSGLLRDELVASPGEVVSVLLPAGWQTAPVLLGAWWSGLTVTGDDVAGAVAAFVVPGSDAAADDVFVVSGHPLGAPSIGFADHQRDFTGAVLPQADRPGVMADPGGTVDAIVSVTRRTSVGTLLERARRGALELSSASRRADVPPSTGHSAEAPPSTGHSAEAPPSTGNLSGAVTEHGNGDGARPVLLSVVDWTLPEGIAATLLAVLAADGTLVQCPPSWDIDRLTAVARAERATATVGIELADLPSVSPPG